MKSAAVTIRLPKDMKKELESLAKEEKIPVSDLIRESSAWPPIYSV